jgi:hypothetical protein
MKDKLRTIVGGRSREHSERNNFPRGIEILLKKAKVDIDFQKVFLEDPLAAAESIELKLEENEKKILSHTLKPVLKTMIDRTFVPKDHTNLFLTAKTAAMIALVFASTAVARQANPMEMGATARYESQEDMRPQLDRQPTDRQITRQRMRAVQEALERFKKSYGTYPSTKLWLNGNPLSEFVETYTLYDTWYRKLHYEAVTENEVIVNYKLESLGEDENISKDNIRCPINSRKHSF